MYHTEQVRRSSSAVCLSLLVKIVNNCFELLFLYTLYMHIYIYIYIYIYVDNYIHTKCTATLIKRTLLEYKSELLQYISTVLQYLSAILLYVNIM